MAGLISAKLVEDVARELMARAAIDIPGDYRDGVRRARDREGNRIARFVLEEMLGNWEIVPQWQLQSPEFFTPQSGVDSNLNGDSAPDRTVFNPSGTSGTGSAVIPVCTIALSATNTCPAANTVGYFAKNANAQYIQAGLGALSNIGRNTLSTPRTNNWDMTVVKRFNTSERTNIEFQATAFNLFNHSQFVPGSVNAVTSIGYTTSAATSFVRVNNPAFNDPTQAFANNARTMQLAAKFNF